MNAELTIKIGRLDTFPPLVRIDGVHEGTLRALAVLVVLVAGRQRRLTDLIKDLGELHLAHLVIKACRKGVSYRWAVLGGSGLGSGLPPRWCYMYVVVCVVCVCVYVCVCVVGGAYACAGVSE